jgi:plastocyanin
MKTLSTMLAVALVSAGLLGCGGGDETTADSAATSASSTPAKEELPLLDDLGGDEHVRYVADPEGSLAFNVALASTLKGLVTIEFVNPQKGVRHNVALEAPNGRKVAETKTIGYGRTSTKVVLKPGVFVAYCSIPGHRKGGMVGHLTVHPN